MSGLRARIVVSVFAMFLALGANSIKATAQSFSTLQPGQFREINQNLRINIVFVGYHQGGGPRDINEAAFRAGLPPFGKAADFKRGQWLGNRFNYDYRLVYANQNFEDQFFGFLSANSFPYGTVSPFQDYYNNETTRSLTIPEDYYIDSTLTEKWLGDHSASVGVDSSQYTIFFINWFGKPGFRFHTFVNYLRPDPDPDTGFDTAANSWYSDMMAWGGTTADDEQNGLGSTKRIWFYDLSAGPDGNSKNYILDIGDITGDGYDDYRIPPIWEYGNMSAYRPFDDLSGDLASVVRYIALDCLFTTSPIFNPDLANPMPTSIQDDLNYYDGDAPATGRSLTNAPRLKQEWSKLRPDNQFSVKQRNLSYSGQARDVYLCSIQSFGHPNVALNCYPGSMPGALFDLNNYHFDHLNEYVSGNPDYQAVTFTYTVKDSDFYGGALGIAFPFLPSGGLRNGFTYTWLPASSRQYTGNTDLAMHEVGHHLGMNHPHDTYDIFDGYFYLATSEPFFWLGDESESVMGYRFLTYNFGQFDRDNMDRWLTAMYINHSNELLAGIIANNDHSQFFPRLTRADNDAADSLAAYQRMDYRIAVSLAKRSYDNVLKVAQRLGVQISPLQPVNDANAAMTENLERDGIADRKESKLKRLPADELPTGPNVVETEDFDPVRPIADPFYSVRKSRSSNTLLFSPNSTDSKKRFVK